MRRKLRIAFVVLSVIGWVLVFASLRISGAWVMWTIGLPVAIGFGIAAFALKPRAGEGQPTRGG